MATTAFAIRDFNPKDSAHAGRTMTKSSSQMRGAQAVEKVSTAFFVSQLFKATTR
jgi:hypothetical protein